MDIEFNLLKELSELFGVSGREEQVSQYIYDWLKNHKLKPKKDVHGNITVILGDSSPTVLLSAHIDEVGVVVNYIDQRGFLKIYPVGNICKESLIGERVIFENGIYGIVYSQKTKPQLDNNFKNLFVDIGVNNKEEAEKKVPTGSFGTFTSLLMDYEPFIVGKGFEGRIGAYILLKVIEEIKDKKLPNKIVFGFTVQKEFSMLGARILGNSIKPKLAISLDITEAINLRDKSSVGLELGKGPAIKVVDASLIANKGLKDFMIAQSEKNKIPYQLEVISHLKTDAGTISLTGKGVPSIGISIPTRYMYTPSEMVDKDDINNAIILLTKVLTNKKLVSAI